MANNEYSESGLTELIERIGQHSKSNGFTLREVEFTFYMNGRYVHVIKDGRTWTAAIGSDHNRSYVCGGSTIAECLSNFMSYQNDKEEQKKNPSVELAFLLGLSDDESRKWGLADRLLERGTEFISDLSKAAQLIPQHYPSANVRLNYMPDYDGGGDSLTLYVYGLFQSDKNVSLGLRRAGRKRVFSLLEDNQIYLQHEEDGRFRLLLGF